MYSAYSFSVDTSACLSEKNHTALTSNKTLAAAYHKGVRFRTGFASLLSRLRNRDFKTCRSLYTMVSCTSFSMLKDSERSESLCNSHSSSFCRSEEHTSELQSRENLVCRLLLGKKKP